MEKQYDVVGAIIDFENGDLDDKGMLELFCNLIKTGQCWSLQGMYGRTASELINRGYITKEGELTEYAKAVLV